MTLGLGGGAYRLGAAGDRESERALGASSGGLPRRRASAFPNVPRFDVSAYDSEHDAKVSEGIINIASEGWNFSTYRKITLMWTFLLGG